MGMRMPGYIIAFAVTLFAGTAFAQDPGAHTLNLEDFLPPPIAPKNTERERSSLPLSLADVPEVHIRQPISGAIKTPEGQPMTSQPVEANQNPTIKRIVDNVHALNLKKTDGFIEALMSKRPDLKGLSFAMGDACRMNSHVSEQFLRGLEDLRNSKAMEQVYSAHGIKPLPMECYAAVASLDSELDKGWAEEMFDELSFDFGCVPPTEQILSHPFRVVNNTKDSVCIRRVVPPGCSCISAAALKTTLAPGEETAIIVKFDSRRFRGSRTGTVWVILDSPRLSYREEVQLVIQANSRSDLQCYPECLNFEKVKQGNAVNTQMCITFYGRPEVVIKDAICESNCIQPKLQELRREDGDVIYLLSATLRSDLPDGKWYTHISLKTNSAEIPWLRVPVTVEVEPATGAVRSSVIRPLLEPVKVKKSERQVNRTGSKIDMAPSVRVASLMQVLATESADIRIGLVKYLDGLPEADATRALAKLAIFSVEPEIHSAAVRALKLRRDRDYTDILLAGLNYPWPSVAERSSAAIVELGRTDLVPHLVNVLENPDPRAPQTRETDDGKKVSIVRELVRINHLHNCLLCHAPATSSREGVSSEETKRLAPLTAQIPVPGEPLNALSAYYSPNNRDILVRFDVTYLRQDFSQNLPVKGAAPWPEMQRYDFLIRTREVTEQEAATYRKLLQSSDSPYRRAAQRALRELTGRSNPVSR